MTKKIKSIQSKQCPNTKDNNVFKLFWTNDRIDSAKKQAVVFGSGVFLDKLKNLLC